MTCKLFLSIMLIFGLLNSSFVASVGASAEMWSQTYDGVAYSLVVTSDGGFAFAGSKSGDFWLVKTDENGVLEWNQKYSGARNDEAYSLIQTNDGGYALAGKTLPFNASWLDFYLVKTDSLGYLEWNKTYGGPNYEQANSIIQTSDGGYTLTGNSLLIKTDSNGNMEWNKTYSGTFNSIVQTSDEGYALAGYTRSIDTNSDDFFLITTDAAGNLQWNRTYGEEHVDMAYSLIVKSDDGFALAGSSGYSAMSAFCLVKTDPNGVLLWNKTCSGNTGSEVYSFVQTFDGGYALAGPGFGFVDFDFLLVKTDESGNVEWSQSYGGDYPDFARALVQTIDGGFALIGDSISYNGSWLIKTDQHGIIPEFPSWTLFPLFLIASMLVLLFRNRNKLFCRQSE